MRLKRPSFASFILLILGILFVSLAIYGIVAFQDAVRYFVNTLMTGNIQAIMEAFASISATTGYLITGIVTVAIIFVALMFYGVYVDMANRSGFPVTSRVKLLFSPIIYLGVLTVTVVPIFLLIAQPLLSLQLSDLIIWIIPAGLAVFGLLILAGSLPLWLLNRKETSLTKAILLSARLMLSPVIDAFWSAAASFVGIAIAMPVLQISAMTSLLTALGEFRAGLSQENPLGGVLKAFENLFGYALSDSALLTYMIPFLVVGILMAIHIYKRGPSHALADFFLLMAVVMPISVIVGAYILAAFLGDWGSVFWTVILIPLAIVCAVYFFAYLFSAFLTAGLRISGIFGLVIALLSAMLLVLFFGVIPNIPLVGGLVMNLISSYVPWVLTVAGEVGTMGIVAGVIIIVLALKEGEEKQVFSQAIAVSVGASTVLPFLFVLVLRLPGLLGGIVGSALVFALISPIYLLAVTLLRLRLAIKTFISPKQDKKWAQSPATQ